MPTKKKYKRIIAYDSSSGESNTADPSSGEDNPDSDRQEEDPEETDLRAEIGREIERLREQTPAPTTQVGCSTGRPVTHRNRTFKAHRYTVKQRPILEMKPPNQEKGQQVKLGRNKILTLRKIK